MTVQIRPPKLGPRWTAIRGDADTMIVWLHHHPKRAKREAKVCYAGQGVQLDFRPGRWAKR